MYASVFITRLGIFFLCVLDGNLLSSQRGKPSFQDHSGRLSGPVPRVLCHPEWDLVFSPFPSTMTFLASSKELHGAPSLRLSSTAPRDPPCPSQPPPVCPVWWRDRRHFCHIIALPRSGPTWGPAEAVEHRVKPVGIPFTTRAHVASKGGQRRRRPGSEPTKLPVSSHCVDTVCIRPPPRCTVDGVERRR
jgi:hypothetical protein